MEPDELKQAQEQMNEIWAQVQAVHEHNKKQAEQLGELDIKDWTERLEGVDKEALAGMQSKMDEIEKRLNRPMSAGAGLVENEIKHEALWQRYLGKDEVTQDDVRSAVKAFHTFLRKGDDRMAADEFKLLSRDDATQGGFLVHPEFGTEIIKELAEISEIRQISRVRQTSTNVFKAHIRTERAGAAWVGERDRDELTNSQYGLKEIPNNTMRATTQATREMLEDSAFPLEAEIRSDFSEDFALTEGRAFVEGSGHLQPEGLLHADNGVAMSANTHASELRYEGLVNVSHEINSNYRNNARFLMNLRTLGRVRLLEDSAGALIFMPPTAGSPATILGFPYTIAQDMPDVAAGTFPVMFGDFRRGYLIIERVMFDLLRDPYTAKRDGAVEFTAYMRVGGQVVLAAALRKLRISETV